MKYPVLDPFVLFLFLSSFLYAVTARPLLPRQSLNTGSCGSVQINYALGLDGRTEFSYQPANLKDFSHGSSTQISDITSFICNRLRSPCNAPDATLQACSSAQSAASSQSGAAAASTWNQAFGAPSSNVATTSAANVQTTPAPTTAAATQTTQQSQATSTIANNQQTTAITTQQNNGGQVTTGTQAQATTGAGVTRTATPTTGLGSSPASTGIAQQDDPMAQCMLVPMIVTYTIPDDESAQDNDGDDKPPANGGSSLNFGKCTDPTIIFGAGLDGRKATDFVFINNNVKEFNHGSDFDPSTIMEFTCNNLVNNCGLTNSDRAVIICRAAVGPAAAFGRDGAAADSFNGALGFKTDYSSVVMS